MCHPEIHPSPTQFTSPQISPTASIQNFGMFLDLHENQGYKDFLDVVIYVFRQSLSQYIVQSFSGTYELNFYVHGTRIFFSLTVR